MWFVFFTACSETPPPAPAPAPAPDAAPVRQVTEEVQGLGWVSEIAWHPDRLQALRDTNPAGWEALRARRPPEAWSAFTDDTGRARSAFELGVLHRDLARLSSQAHEQLWSTWTARGNAPPETALIAALSAACNEGESATFWAAKVTDGPDKPLAETITRGQRATDASTNGPFGKRFAIHRSALDARDPSPLSALAVTPVIWREEVVDGQTVQRSFWDPCLHRALSDTWFAVAEKLAGRGPGWRAMGAVASPEAGLAGTYLGAWLTGDDVRSELAVLDEPGELGARSATARKLGVGGSAFPSDDPGLAAGEISTLDAALDAWRSRIADQAPEAGAALVQELKLVDRFRAEWILARARVALHAGRPQVAAALAAAAHDPATQGLSDANGPALYAVLASAELEAHRTHEAIAHLQALVETYPEVTGVKETLAELAVLQDSAPPPAPPPPTEQPAAP